MIISQSVLKPPTVLAHVTDVTEVTDVTDVTDMIEDHRVTKHQAEWK